VTENGWYTSVPTVLPNSKTENETLKSYSALSEKFNAAKGGANAFVDIIVSGFAFEGMFSAEEAVTTISETMGGADYLFLKQEAYDRLIEYFNK